MYQVMLVDNEPNITEGLSCMIKWQSLGFNIKCTAGSGREALDKLERGHYHLIITDIRMPQIDGLELIREIRQRNASVHLLIMSGYNDFSYAKQAISLGVKGYMLKPVQEEELVEYLNIIKRQLDSEFETVYQSREKESTFKEKIISTVSEGMSDPEVLSRLEGEFGIYFKGPYYRHISLEIEQFKQIVNLSIRDARLLHYGVKNIISEMLLSLPHSNGQLYEGLEGSLGIIWQSPLPDDTMLQSNLAQILEAVQGYLKLKLYAGVGMSVAHLHELSLSKEQSRMAVDEAKLRRGCNQTWFFTPSPASPFNLAWDMQDMLDAVQESDFSKLEREIKKLMDEAEEKNYMRKSIDSILIHLLYSIQKWLEKSNINVTVTDIEIPLLEWDDLDDLHKRMFGYCKELNGRLYKDGDNHHNRLIAQVEEFIHENYVDELSLKSIAKVFFMNPAYLGQLFKKIKKDNFNDYLNKIRISKIKQLINKNDGKIYDVIMNAGYKNPEYFYRKFKQYEGVSFAEYQENRRSTGI